jgi:hypothetical protein
MFTSTILLTTALLSALTSAAPTYPPPSQTASITLIDAVNHEWPIEVPCDQTFFLTGVYESISHVRLNNQKNIRCEFYGVDGLEIVSLPGETKYMDVGPPQTIFSGK